MDNAKTSNELPATGWLPYADTWQGYLVTLAINLAAALLLYFVFGINRRIILVDALGCGVITAITTVAIVYPAVCRLRSLGLLPRAVPEHRWLLMLPKTPVPLIAVLGVVFGAVMYAIAWLILWYFSITEFALHRFIVWKLVYSTIISFKLTELVIMRLAQPDCAAANQPEQTGTAVVRNPLPGRETFKHLFNTVVDDFGINIIIGLFVGGTVITADHAVIIPATTRSGIVISGLVLGAIVSFFLTLPVATSIKAVRDEGQLPPLEKSNRWVSWIPEKPLSFTLALLVPIMGISAAVLWAMLTFFGFEVLNFFQFFIVRTIYVVLLSKALVPLAVWRYRQPELNAELG